MADCQATYVRFQEVLSCQSSSFLIMMKSITFKVAMCLGFNVDNLVLILLVSEQTLICYFCCLIASLEIFFQNQNSKNLFQLLIDQNLDYANYCSLIYYNFIDYILILFFFIIHQNIIMEFLDCIRFIISQNAHSIATFA